MKRRAVLIVTLLAVAGTAVGTASADVVKKPKNELCVVLAQNDAGTSTKDICVNWGVLPQ